jgi:hypothetical protein
MPTINFRAEEELKSLLKSEAKEAGYQSLSDYLTAIINGRHKKGRVLGKGKKQRVANQEGSVIVKTRISREEKFLFDEIRNAENVSEAFLLLRQVRILITKEPHFSKAEIAELRNSNQQLIAIGRNLNQIVQQINAGLVTDSRLSQKYIEQLTAYIDDVSTSVRQLTAKTLQRAL